MSGQVAVFFTKCILEFTLLVKIQLTTLRGKLKILCMITHSQKVAIPESDISLN